VSNPIISAIMPAYNSERTIRDAIRSVRWQTDPDWELIVVDDGSSDNTASVAMREAEEDSRIRVLSLPHRGRGATRNTCLEHARGELIAICDSDDISLPKRFEQQRAVFSSIPSPDVVSCSRVISFANDSSNGFASEAAQTDAKAREQFLKSRMPILFATAMLRSSLFERFGGFDPELQRNQDYGFFARNYEQIRFAMTREPLILYRTSGRINRYAMLSENNFYRFYASRRACGERRSAAAFRSSARAIAHQRLLVPLQFAWYATRILLRGHPDLTQPERRLLEETLARVRRAGAEASQEGTTT
jgi:glycosyltransferase involved in cell wall biosynthesis